MQNDRDLSLGTGAEKWPAPTRVFDLFTHQLKHHPQPDTLAYKVAGAWRKFSAREIAGIVRALAAGLHAAGVGPGDRVANSTETNRPEWNFIDLAVLSLGAVHVPIYPTLTAEEFCYILEDSGAKFIFVSTEALRVKVASVLDRLPALEAIYVYEQSARYVDCGLEGLRLAGETLLREKPGESGVMLDALAAAVRPEDLATLIYTSGTTGQPKGVMLSHANLVSNCLAIVPLIDARPGERTISFLPLCHIFERTLTNAYLYSGMSVYYAESLERVGENMREVHPRFLRRRAAHPGENFRADHRARQRAQGPAQAAFLLGAGTGRAHRSRSAHQHGRPRPAGGGGPARFFQMARGAGRARSTGSYAVRRRSTPGLARIFWNAGIKVYEGYGPTEAAPVITSNHPDGWGASHRHGGPGDRRRRDSPGPEDGEILYRGPNVMLGYYHRPDLTAETVDAEGFLHTGDVGEFIEAEDGIRFLRITDRKKEIFKTSGGKYIAPQPIENRLKESPYISQAMVVGEYRKFPGALIVPDFVAVREKIGGALPESDAEVAALPAARALIAGELQRLNASFAQYARVKDFCLLGQEWTAAGGELTPDAEAQATRNPEKIRPRN